MDRAISKTTIAAAPISPSDTSNFNSSYSGSSSSASHRNLLSSSSAKIGEEESIPSSDSAIVPVAPLDVVTAPSGAPKDNTQIAGRAETSVVSKSEVDNFAQR